MTLVSFGCCSCGEFDRLVSVAGWRCFHMCSLLIFFLICKELVTPPVSVPPASRPRLQLCEKGKDLLRIQFLWSCTQSWTNKFCSIWPNSNYGCPLLRFASRINLHSAKESFITKQQTAACNGCLLHTWGDFIKAKSFLHFSPSLREHSAAYWLQSPLSISSFVNNAIPYMCSA